MNRTPNLPCDVAVIGAGPAGIAAATVAAEAGARVILLDDNAAPGGQIWRGGKASAGNSATEWLTRLGRSAARQFSGTRVFELSETSLAAETAGGRIDLRFGKAILATGARELFLPFPGWTLPGVLGAGGLQALIKSGLSVEGKRIVIAGTGPLLLAVAAYAKQKGAIIMGIAEQTSWVRFARFGLSALLSGQKSRQALDLLWHTRGVPYWKNAWPVAALGTTHIRAVRLFESGKTREIACDYLACGFHLVPSTELARFAGCQLEKNLVAVDEFQRTSLPGILSAGESTGIGGVEKSLCEGQIAGYSAAGRLDQARAMAPARTAAGRQVALLNQAFALRSELQALPEEDTVLCRCEDVAWGKLRGHASWRSAKLETRCGMGPCQGRVCGAAAEFLFGWETGSSRPPVVPVSCGSLAALSAGTPSKPIQGELQ